MTYNRDDYPDLDGAWRRQGRLHSGIPWCNDRIIPRRDIGGVIAAIARVHADALPLAGLCLPLLPAPSPMD